MDGGQKGSHAGSERVECKTSIYLMDDLRGVRVSRGPGKYVKEIQMGLHGIGKGS